MVAVMTISPLGDSAMVITLGTEIDEVTLQRVRTCATALEGARIPGVTDVVPANATIGVFYNVNLLGHDMSPSERVRRWITDTISLDVLQRTAGKAVDSMGQRARAVEIPVCYGGPHGPDLDHVAAHTGLSRDEVTALHSGVIYEVSAVGFTPGFPYLSGLPKKLQTPRRPTPRFNVAAGSIGIGGALTGIYPVNSPGGWQIIGRTPLVLFDPRREAPATLRVGDRVSFKAVSEEDFSKWN
jgi:inhibitor of KinA